MLLLVLPWRVRSRLAGRPEAATAVSAPPPGAIKPGISPRLALAPPDQLTPLLTRPANNAAVSASVTPPPEEAFGEPVESLLWNRRAIPDRENRPDAPDDDDDEGIGECEEDVPPLPRLLRRFVEEPLLLGGAPTPGL